MFINLAINLVHVIYNYTDSYNQYNRRLKKNYLSRYRDDNITNRELWQP